MTPHDISDWPAALPRSIRVAATSLCFNLQVASVRFTEIPLLIDDEGTLSYGQAWADCERVAAYLAHALHVAPGDRVLLFMQNSRAFLVAYFGILRMGGVVVPVNPMNKRDELAHYLADSGAVVAFCDASNLATLQSASGTDALNAIVVSALPAAGIDQPAHTPPLHAMADMLSATPVELLEPLRHAPDDLALVLYSSGTTGKPKGCMHTHRSLLASAAIVAHWQQIQPGAVLLAALPWFHITGMQNLLNAPIYGGATVVVLPRWQRDTAAQLIRTHRVTHWTAMPTMVIDLISSPDLHLYDLGSIRRIGGGGAAMPEAVARRLFELTGLSFLEGYGSSETAHALGNPSARHKRQCLGVPLFDTDVRVIDPDSMAELPADEVGEIVIAGPQVFCGYWRNEKATAEAICTLEGRTFVRTGDLGHRDRDGYFFIVDRLKRMVNASGYKVWPAEVEAMLHAHPDIQEACVIAAFDPYRGETVKAVVVARPERRASLTEQDIIDWARERMAAYKYPRLVEFVTELPKAPTGKIAWRELQERERARSAD